MIDIRGESLYLIGRTIVPLTGERGFVQGAKDVLMHRHADRFGMPEQSSSCSTGTSCNRSSPRAGGVISPLIVSVFTNFQQNPPAMSGAGATRAKDKDRSGSPCLISRECFAVSEPHGALSCKGEPS